ncbi:MAG TPA: hypothetical protein ENK00_01455 [Chromatiales bacterium]|nr:hypothetical protein [Chromatiales bacterium]
MSQSDLVGDLKAMLMDAANKFTAAADADFQRHLDLAALDLGRFRPRTLVGTLTLVADQSNYPAPSGLLRPKFPLWGTAEKRARRPWDGNWPGRLPRLTLVENAGTRELWLSPPPTAAQIADLGATYTYYYFAGHVIDMDAAKTSVQPGDRHLLLVRAAAEALQELANNGVTKPVQLGNAGVGSMPKNGTPGALADSLLKHYEAMAA